jgi:2-desacetyl-2-hydroxyethyl bacteriochlorophyllide A dehydrogenase
MRQGYQVTVMEPRRVELAPRETGPPGPGQVLIETEQTLISTGTELTAVTGDFPANSAWSAYIRYPTPLGYSNVGRVIEHGDGVTSLAAGDRVVTMSSHATFAVRGADDCLPVPGVVDAEAAAFSVLAEIVLGGLRRGRLAFGEAIVVVGAGLLGQLAVHFGRRAGAWPIIVLDTAEQRLETARQMGATHALAATAADARSEVERITGGRMADVVFEITGSPDAFPGAVRMARKLGRVVVLGSPRGPVTIDLHDEVHTLSLEIIGAHNSGHPPVETPQNPWTTRRHMQLFLEWQAAGVVDIRPLITHRYDWSEAPDAYAMLLEDRTRALGVLLRWKPE